MNSFLFSLANRKLLLDEGDDQPKPTEIVINREGGGDVQLTSITFIAVALIVCIIVLFCAWKCCGCCSKSEIDDAPDYVEEDQKDNIEAELIDDPEVKIDP